MPRLKIAGISNIEDAKWAAILGVEYISISMVEGSDKKISVDRALEIRNMLPSYTRLITEAGSLDSVNKRDVKKIKSGYVQLDAVSSDDDLAIQEISTDLEDLIILQLDAENEYTGSLDLTAIKYVQLTLKELPGVETLNMIKEKFNMEYTIIHGDLPLSDIKKACEVLQPYAWSIKDIIEKSPRKINYAVMKEYIREISLW